MCHSWACWAVVWGGGGSSKTLICIQLLRIPPWPQHNLNTLNYSFLGGGGGSGHDKLPKLAHQKALEKSLGIKDQSCPVLPLSHKAMW